MKLTVLALAALLTVAAHGATLYDTLGPDNHYHSSGPTIGGPQDMVVGNWIFATASDQATSLTLAMRHISGENRYRLEFVPSGNNGPSGSPFFSTEFSATGDLTTLNLQNGPVLSDSVPFWLVLSAAGQNTQGVWWSNAAGTLGTIAWHDNSSQNFTTSPINWNVLGDQVLAGVQINSGGAPPTATPEPSTALLAASALLIFGWRHRRS